LVVVLALLVVFLAGVRRLVVVAFRRVLVFLTTRLLREALEFLRVVFAFLVL
jgi:hypothetical protein